MLEFLRKHQYGLMLVVAILTIIAFVFLYDKNTYGSNTVQRGSVLKVYKKGYNANELRKLDSYFDVAQQLGMTDLWQSLAGKRFVERVPIDFPANLIIIREKGREMGISPSDAQVEEELRSLPIFSPGGKYSPEQFNRVSSSLAGRGIVGSDLMQLTRDKITLDKIKELQMASFQPPSTEVEDKFAASNEEITAYALSGTIEDFKEKVEVTDEEIQQRYEDTKETLLTEERRKIEYVHFKSPEFPTPAMPVPEVGGGLDLKPSDAGSGMDGISLTPGKPAPAPEATAPETDEDPAADATEEEESRLRKSKKKNPAILQKMSQSSKTSSRKRLKR